MAIHTLICSSGRRLNIRPSKTSPGLVEVSILNADRELIAACTLCPESAGVAAQALEIEADAAQSKVVSPGIWAAGFCEGGPSDGCVLRKSLAKPKPVSEFDKGVRGWANGLEVSNGNV